AMSSLRRASRLPLSRVTPSAASLIWARFANRFMRVGALLSRLTVWVLLYVRAGQASHFRGSGFRARCRAAAVAAQSLSSGAREMARLPAPFGKRLIRDGRPEVLLGLVKVLVDEFAAETGQLLARQHGQQLPAEVHRLFDGAPRGALADHLGLE